MSEAKILAFILVFMGLIGLLGFFGQDMASGNDLDALPVLDDDIGLFGTIGYGFEFVGYLFGFRAFVVFGFPVIVSNTISLIINAMLMYVVIRLIRGGG